MIDTHCHLYDEAFDEDRTELVKGFADHGIKWVLLPNEDNSSIEKLLQVCESYSGCMKAMVGLHPTSVKTDWREELEKLSKYRGNTQVVAIGEIGMDLYWDKTYAAEQEEALKIQIGWAKEQGLPVVLHCRKAYNELIKVLKRHQDGKLKGVMHCFPGNVQQAREVIDLGLKLGIGGVVTYKNSDMGKVVGEVPLDSMVLETDAPYLSPVPFRGKRNQPEYIKYIAQKIAEVRSISVEEVLEVTDRVACELFKLS